MSMPIIKPSGIKRKESITDIVESVALEQTALSHILNAEGEKIQKVLEEERNTTNGDVLKVNESVQTTINSITRLETILQGKLELFKDCLCDEDCYKNPLELKILLSQIDSIDTSSITKDGNIYTIKLANKFPRTITFSGIPVGTTTTTTAIGTLPNTVTLANNVLTFAATTTIPYSIAIEVKLTNGLNREIYTVNIISQ